MEFLVNADAAERERSKTAVYAVDAEQHLGNATEKLTKNLYRVDVASGAEKKTKQQRRSNRWPWKG